MNMDEFQKLSVSTLAIGQKDLAALSHRGFGLAGESGHVVALLKKIVRDKNGKATPEDVEQLKKRLGDVMYYAAVLAEYYDVQLSDIAEQNMQQSIDFKNNRPQ
jgi:NTP pyrophosphatase (non-canonical NTP hydrolase)